MSSISIVLSFFAFVLVLTEARSRATAIAWIGALAVGLWMLRGPAQVAVPIATILSVGLGASITSLRPR